MNYTKVKTPRKNRIKGTKGDFVFDIVNTFLLFLVLVIIGYPMLVVISSSFSSPEALMAGKVRFLPVEPTLMGYEAVLQHKQIWVAFGNSAFYMIAGTAINMVITVLAAYPLSRKDLPVRNFISLMFAFTMWFSGGLIPSYLLVRNLGMYNTRWAMLIPCAMSVWNMVIVRTYFQDSIPESLFESARLDGCDDFRYLLKIALPISKPVLAVITLYYAVAHWNVFQSAYIYLQKPDLQPIQIVLRDILLLSQMQDLNTEMLDSGNSNAQQLSELLKYSLVLVSSLPMILFYLLVQKHFTKGIMVGSVKG